MPATLHPNAASLSGTQPIWRYMSFAKFASIVYDSSLFLSRSDLFEDTHEATGLLSYQFVQEMLRESDVDDDLGQEYVKHVINARQQTFVSCWHINDHESAAMWKLYGPTKAAIAVQSTVDRLKEQFTEDYWIMQVEYIHPESRNDLISLSHRTKGYDARQLEHCLANLKRLSFRHEDELRVVHRERNTDTRANLRSGISCHVNLAGLLDQIIVAPDASGWEVDLTEKLLSFSGLDIAVKQSSLYESPLM